LDDLEHDGEMRSRITLYKDPTYAKNEMLLDDEDENKGKGKAKAKNPNAIRLEELFDALDF
jgi:hypothetical protein